MIQQLSRNLRRLMGILRMRPSSRILQVAMGHRVSRVLYVVTKLGVPDLLKDGPRSADALAAATGSNPDALFRVMRVLADLGIFAEVGPRGFALTPLSESLRSDATGSVRAAVLYIAGDTQWDVYRELEYGVQTGQPAFDRALGHGPVEHFREHPELSLLVDQAMAVYSASTSPAVAEAYDFSKFNTIVDVGGGNGTLLAAILKKHSRLRGTLFDLPHVIEHAQAAGLLPAGRGQMQAGDMFQSVPSDADAYMLSSVIHDWQDDTARAILQVCRRAMPSTGKLLLVEMLITPGGSPGPIFADLQMLVMGGRERTDEDFRQLFASAGFRLDRIVPTKSRYSIIEGTPV